MKKIITLLFALAVWAVMPLMAQSTAVISNDTYVDGDSSTWNFTDGWKIKNSASKSFATGNAIDGVKTIKYSRKTNFAIVVPEGKSITAVKFTGYTNGSDQTAYVGCLGTETYSQGSGEEGTNYFPDKTSSASFTITPSAPLSGEVALTFLGDNQVCVIMEISYSEGATGIQNVAQDENRIVKVYSTSGQLVKNNVVRSEAGNSLPKGIYIVEGEKVVVK